MTNHSIQGGDFTGWELPFDDPLLPFQGNITGYLGTSVYPGTETAHINLMPVWAEYGGAGIQIASIETYDLVHPELQANSLTTFEGLYGPVENFLQDGRFTTSIAYANGNRGESGRSISNHGTAVAGIIASEADNGYGIAGIAYEAAFSFWQLGPSVSSVGQFDVSTSSAGGGSPYFDADTSHGANVADGVENGRGGLGTIFFQSAGNDGTNGGGFASNARTSDIGVIPVGMLDDQGNYMGHNYGAALHVSVPLGLFGSNATLSLDISGEGGSENSERSFFTDYYLQQTGQTAEELNITDFDFRGFSGTSAATPVAAGSGAVILEANEKANIFGTNIGWRDFQEIIALSAVETGLSDNFFASRIPPFDVPEGFLWDMNGSNIFNGFGLTFSPMIGFGMLDVHAAVRLAETWSAQSSSSNLVQQQATASLGTTTALDETGIEFQIDPSGLAQGLDIDFVEIDMAFQHSDPRELQITVISPLGTVSHIVDTPYLEDPRVDAQRIADLDLTEFPYSPLSRAFWGESGEGLWTVRVRDAVSNDTNGTVSSLTLRLLGDDADDDDTVYFTADYLAVRERAFEDAGSVGNLQDFLPALADNTGYNSINAAPMMGDLHLDIEAGSVSTVSGESLFRISSTGVYHRAIGGDGDDTLSGNSLENALHGMRGDDLLIGGNGDDNLAGGAGADALRGGAGTDTAVYSAAQSGVSVHLAFSGADVGGGQGRDTFESIENLLGSSFADRLVGDLGNNQIIGSDGNDTVMGKNGDDVLDAGSGDDLIKGGSGIEISFGAEGDDTLFGLSGDDTLHGGQGDDHLYGGRDADSLYGGEGADLIWGNLGGDMLFGAAGSDVLRGGGGNDLLDAGAQDDYLFGGNGQDSLIGGLGNDVLSGGTGGGLADGFSDLFIFDANGFDRVRDFEVGMDIIDITELGFSEFSVDVAPLLEGAASGAATRINFGSGNVIYLENVRIVELTDSDFLL